MTCILPLCADYALGFLIWGFAIVGSAAAFHAAKELTEKWRRK
jgi:hypothetical protein